MSKGKEDVVTIRLERKLAGRLSEILAVDLENTEDCIHEAGLGTNMTWVRQAYENGRLEQEYGQEFEDKEAKREAFGYVERLVAAQMVREQLRKQGVRTRRHS